MFVNNFSGVRKITATADRQILRNVEFQYSVSAQLTGEDLTIGTVYKAGTVVELDKVTQEATVVASSGSSDSGENTTKIQGLLLHDAIVDETGKANCTVLIFGFVNADRIDAVTKQSLNNYKGNLITIFGAIPAAAAAAASIGGGAKPKAVKKEAE